MKLLCRLTLALVPLAAVALCGCNALTNRFSAREEVKSSFKTTAPPQIVVDTFNGSINVVGGPAGEVACKVIKTASGPDQDAADDALEDIEVNMVQEADNTIRVTAKLKNGVQGGNRGASVELRVPAESNLHLQTNNGGISANGPFGDISAETTNGGLNVDGALTNVRLTTSNGSVKLKGGAGRIELESSNGGIDAKTGKGLLTARTSNGSVRFAGELIEGKHSFVTSNGKVSLTLPEDARFKIDASTSMGKITTNFDVKKGKDAGRKHLRGTVGAGEPGVVIEVQTSNGNVEIKKE